MQEVALVADIDSLDENTDRVFLMTVHSAKGLEFDNVYLVGMEDGLFPGFAAKYDFNDSELQEERRLFYVGMTRARKTLTITSAKMRMVRGENEFHKLSMFVEEIAPECIWDESEWNMKPKAEKHEDSYTDRLSNIVKKTSESKPYSKITDMSMFKAVKPDRLDYAQGDWVAHKKFGEGKVISIKDTPKDFEVTVEFDKFGQKRMFAAFAKLTKL